MPPVLSALVRIPRALVLLAMIATMILSSCSEPRALPKRFEVPRFSLTERSGKPFDSASLAGKVWVADFFFTECQGTCLMLSNRFAEIHKATRDMPGVHFVSVSTDPEKDTPEVLRQY